MIRIPKPRIGVCDSTLLRPDWTGLSQRNENAIWLDKNENIDPVLAEKNKSILACLSKEAIFTYPELGLLYQKLAKVMDCDAHQLVMAAGSDGIIRTVFEAFIAPGDVVLHTDPTFAMYYVYSKIYAANSHTVSYEANENGPYLNIPDFLRKIEDLKPRLVCLPNPDSPTGGVQADEDMAAILEKTAAVGSVLLIDEAYFPFYPRSLKDCVNQYPHVIIARSFAKAWGVAGVRVGFGISHPEMAEILHKVRPMYEIGALSAQFLFHLLDHKEDVMQSVKRVLEGKEWFAQQMESLGYRVLRTDGNFIHIAFGDDAEKVEKALSGKVLYRGSFSQPSLKEYSRFSVAPKTIMEQVATYISQAVKR